MKCPLLTDKNYGEQLERTMQKGDCIKEECAWWDEALTCCTVLALSNVLIAIGNTMGKIADRKSFKV